MIKKTDTILITGCGGMLGEAVYHYFKNIGKVYATDIDVNEKWLSYLDVKSEKAVRDLCNKIKPNYIIHLAAFTDLEYCEMHPNETYETNTWGVYNVFLQAVKADIPLLYVSTAGIFDGKKDFYDENDTPRPLSIYGKSKYLSELIVRSFPKSVIVRAGWMVGGGPKKDKKFVNKIMKQLSSGKKELVVVDDKSGTPCYTYDFAKVMFHLLNNGFYGLYHGVCEGGGSRLDVAKLIVETLKLEKKVKIKIVGSDYFQSDYFAPRPASEKLINSKLAEMKIFLTRDWRDCLREYLAKFDWGL